MLSKKICKKCAHKSGWKWDRDDDMRWNKGEMLCELCTGWSWKIKRAPPPECPYKLEHAVAEGLK